MIYMNNLVWICMVTSMSERYFKEWCPLFSNILSRGMMNLISQETLLFNQCCIWWWPSIFTTNRDMMMTPQVTRFMGPTWGPPGSCRPQMGPVLSPWTLLSGPIRWTRMYARLIYRGYTTVNRLRETHICFYFVVMHLCELSCYVITHDSINRIIIISLSSFMVMYNIFICKLYLTFRRLLTEFFGIRDVIASETIHQGI